MEHLAQLVAAVAAALTPVFAWFGRRVLKRLDTILDTFDGVEAKIDSVNTTSKELTARVGVIEGKVETLGKEFKTNGGTSVRDTLDELREKLTILDGRHRARWDGDGLATYECDAHGECTYASAALAELFGLPPEQLHGRGWLAAVGTAEERTRVWHNWETAVKAEIPYEDVYVVIRPDGARNRVRTYVRCTRGSDGKVLCYHGVVTKLSD